MKNIPNVHYENGWILNKLTTNGGNDNRSPDTVNWYLGIISYIKLTL